MLSTLIQKAVRWRPTWSQLSAFGNSPLARLVVLAPVVAVFVKLQETYLAATFGLSQAEWLYWSLMAIALGQVLYSVFCPRIIKKYGSDRERHTIEALSSMPLPQIELLRQDRIRSLYTIGGGRLRLGLDPNAADYIARMGNGLRQNGLTFSSTPEKAANAFRQFYDVVTNERTRSPAGLNYVRLAEMQAVFPQAFLGQANDAGILYEAATLSQILNEAAHSQGGDNDWKVNALDWRYRHANNSQRALVLVVGALYLLGSLYFVWRALQGLSFMLGHLLARLS